jgi:hypothetical protein
MMQLPPNTRDASVQPKECQAARPPIREQLALDLAEEWGESSDDLPGMSSAAE